MKLDPYNHKERYLNWKEKVKDSGISDISKYNSDLFLQYLEDMENGINVASSSVKGARSYIRLNTLRDKLRFFGRKFQECFNVSKITEISENQVCRFFSDMRKGTLTRPDGKRYQSTQYFVKNFKAFWHWWMKINRKQGIEIKDITLDLDTRGEKPRWVYMTEEQVKELCNNCLFKYKVLIMFLFDTGIRAPTELLNVKVSDFYNNYKELHIREEVSKTFGRKIKLMLCSSLIKEFIEKKNLSGDDFVFQYNYAALNQYLKLLGKRVL